MTGSPFFLLLALTRTAMPTSITNAKRNNWVDRGESALPQLRKTLSHFFERFDASDGEWLDEQATIVFGMVDANASEVQVSAYLRSVVREARVPTREPLGSRMAAVALWHIAKAAIGRDYAERVLRDDAPTNAPTNARLSDWIAQRLLSPDELSEHERG